VKKQSEHKKKNQYIIEQIDVYIKLYQAVPIDGRFECVPVCPIIYSNVLLERAIDLKPS
jgi:hypothetical protein